MMMIMIVMIVIIESVVTMSLEVIARKLRGKRRLLFEGRIGIQKVIRTPNFRTSPGGRKHGKT